MQKDGNFKMSIRQINPEVKTVHLVKNALSHVTLDNSHKHCGTQAFSRISKISLDAWKKKNMFEFQSSVFVCLLYINIYKAVSNQTLFRRSPF